MRRLTVLQPVRRRRSRRLFRRRRVTMIDLRGVSVTMSRIGSVLRG
jgi:hypothetical protein